MEELKRIVRKAVKELSADCTVLRRCRSEVFGHFHFTAVRNCGINKACAQNPLQRRNKAMNEMLR